MSHHHLGHNGVATGNERSCFTAMPLTPATTPSRTSFSTSSSSPSASTQVSEHNSPELRAEMIGQKPVSLDPITTLHLPATPPLMGSTSSSPWKPGLIRRASRGAAGMTQRLRGRQSSSALQHRDQRGGSVVRRRSESKSMIDGSHDVSEAELDPEDNAVKDRLETTMSSVRDKPSMLSRRSSERSTAPPQMPPPTTFTRLTGRDRKPLRLAISQEQNKITWSTSSNDNKKLDKKNQLYMDDIQEIRVGDQAALTLGDLQIDESSKPLLLTIKYYEWNDRKPKLLYLLAETPQDRSIWRDALYHVWHDRGHVMTGMVEQSEKALNEHWRRTTSSKYAEDSTSEPSMDFDTIQATCRAYHFDLPVTHLRALFDHIDVPRRGSLGYGQYKAYFRQLTEPKPVRAVFDAVPKTRTGCIDFGSFLSFLKNVQQVNVDNDFSHWEDAFAAVTSAYPAHEGEEPVMTFEAFRDFLSSDTYNSALLGQSLDALDRPLSDYFVWSSHNTYLLGRQLKGESSVEAYIIALKKGARCIEVDCWDGKDGQPIVNHGRTWTKSVTFVDCIKAIRGYAFFSSKYPLIISLEVHCGPKQQEIMTAIMKEHLGPYLVTEKLANHRNRLPSPEDLQEKILIKVKRPMLDRNTQPVQKPRGHNRVRSLSEPTPSLSNIAAVSSRSGPPVQPYTPMLPQHARTFNDEMPDAIAATPDDTESEVEDPVTNTRKPRTSKIIPLLGELGVYTRGTPFSAWTSKESKQSDHIYSFNERTFHGRSKEAQDKAALQQHNANYLMRIYPFGTRVMSDNFNPILFWRRGVQMVATNWQTRDLGSEINDAMFASIPDKRGYVLKPQELDVFKHQPSDGGTFKLPKKQVKFTVRIIAAQHLSTDNNYGPQNPYVMFEMYSAEDKSLGIAWGSGGTDNSSKDGSSGAKHPISKYTKIVSGNGYNPVWNESITIKLHTKYPSLVFVRWLVLHSTNAKSINSKGTIGAFTAKLSSLAEGYRYIPLYNQKGDEMHSKLFCHIKKEEPEDIEEEADLPDTLTSNRSGEESRTRKRDKFRGFLGQSSCRRTKADSVSGTISPLASTANK